MAESPTTQHIPNHTTAIGPSPIEIIKRQLSEDEAREVVHEIRDLDTITGYSISEWTRTREVFAAVEKSTGRVCGVALVHHLFDRWSEIAVVYVREGDRCRGIGRALVERCMADIAGHGRRALMFFCSDDMERLARSLDLSISGGEKQFINASLRRWVFIRCVYPIQWLSNSYRRSEIRRKTAQFGRKFQFKIATIETIR